MFAPSRTEVRRFFSETWRKHERREPLAGLERTALTVLLEHPEYQSLLEDPSAGDREYSPESGELNPFLHLSLHLAIEEQLSIDQPPGIRSHYERLVAKKGSEHEAKHDVLECLGETVWEAQRNNRPPDQNAYLECLTRKAGRA